MKRYVIVGNGVAAAACVEGVRSRDRDGSITVISAETRPVYCRPLISYYLEGKTSPEKMDYRPADFYEKNGCRVLYGRRAVALDPNKKTVTLDGGEALPYDALLIATGSRPFVPPFEGLDTVEKKYSFMTLDDALALEGALDGKARVLIVGAGRIGLKCADGIKDRVGQITVCDLADRVLSSILDADCAAVVQKHLEESGIDFLLGDTALKFDRNVATMKSGKTVDFDVLVTAIGVRPNTALLAEAGGGVNRGILVGEGMETSLPGIWAAGDCAETLDVSSGTPGVLAVLPNASLQGYCAGVNMAGGEEKFDKGIRLNSIGFYGLHIMSAGTPTEPVLSEVTETSCKKLFAKDGVLTGFILIGDVSRAGIYTSLIRERTPLDTIDFEAVMREPSLLPFGREYREKKLGGAV